MTDPIFGNRSAWAALTNMDLCLQTMIAIQNVQDGGQRMALFAGPSGWGKTYGAAYTTAVTDAVYVAAKAVWTHKSLLEALARELGIQRVAKTTARILDQIIEHLARDRRPIIIDEMDYIVNRKSVDVIRDIYDATLVPVLMIGMEALPSRLKEWEQFDNRLLTTVLAQPASQEDGRKLRDLYCRQVAVSDDLADYITHACAGVARRIVTNLIAAQTFAIEQLDTMSIDRAAWGNRPLKTGELQIRRSGGVL
jgi:DNA transposition AAA+ family ATPase